MAPDEDAPGYLRITAAVAIPLDELEWRFGPSGGPGGQHANRAHTRAEVRFDIAASPSLEPRARERLLSRVGPMARAASDDERSQVRNRSKALDRLRSLLADALREPKPRRRTKPGPGAVQRRIDAKRRRGELKRGRRRLDEGW